MKTKHAKVSKQNERIFYKALQIIRAVSFSPAREEKD